MKKVYLHIGAGKTGTSAIQSYLAMNEDNLLDNGYYYPAGSLHAQAKNMKITSGNASELAKILLDTYNEETKEKLEKIIYKLISESDNKDIILSSELIQNYNQQSMEIFNKLTLKSGYKIIIVYYIRAIADHVVSQYQQFLKRLASTNSLEKHILNKKNTFLKILIKTEEIFGKENLIIKNYDKVKENLFENFLEDVLHIDNISKFVIPSGKINRSLSPYEVSFMKHINNYFTEKKHATFVSNALIHNKPNISYDMTIEKKDLEILEEMYSEDINILNIFLKEKEQPLTLVDNLKIVDIDKPVVFNAFQESVFAILAELVKEAKK